MNAPTLGLRERLLIAGTLAFVVVALVRLGGIATPLGHDEAVYATAARALLNPGAAASGWATYRSLGMKVLGLPGVLLGGSETALRLICWMSAVALVVIVWQFGRRVVGGLEAVFAVAIFAGSASFLRRAPELLTDIPSACCFFGVLWVFQRELNREGGISWRVLVVAPLGAAAFWIRYGTSLYLALAAIALCLFFGPELWRARLKIAATLALFLLLILEFFLYAKQQTGSYLGILLNPTASEHHVWWRTLEVYKDELPSGPAGPLGGAFLLLGLVWGGAVVLEVLIRRRRDAASRMMAALWIVAAGHALIHSISFHYEPRYLYIDVIVFLLLGVRALAPSFRRLGAEQRTEILVAASMILLIYGRVGYLHAFRSFERLDRARAVLVETAKVIRRRGGRRCRVISSYVPHMTWYAGCRTIRFPDHVPSPDRLRRLAPPGRGYVVFFEHGKQQPSERARAKWFRHLHLLGTVDSKSEIIGDAKIYRVE